MLLYSNRGTAEGVISLGGSAAVLINGTLVMIESNLVAEPSIAVVGCRCEQAERKVA